MFTSAQAVDWVNRSATLIGENAQALTKLDQAIGDGDHGSNMSRGFRTVTEKVAGLENPDLGTLFKTVSIALIGKVGGASGPLYGSLYLSMAKALGDATEVDDETLAKGLRAGLDGVVARGKAQLEDKTMVDALTPALDTLEASIGEGKELGAALDDAVEAAWKGVEATIPLIARKGRASYLGERSRDHQDPGATSSHLLVKALADTVNGR
jgi:dihydroxyacetone kinase-like protein